MRGAKRQRAAGAATAVTFAKCSGRQRSRTRCICAQKANGVCKKCSQCFCIAAAMVRCGVALKVNVVREAVTQVRHGQQEES
ncbi:hypothetical protein NPIL_178391 [Nephila pilipes]|uniref:Uncharacterized protein n=1 Tax=Nephila pilipes TaxID=299642 RepID=A0A8X6PU14_NEPPI|nr:hypothetical protein NPIL_178391 [Nephila pilipes]